ncbi:MAG TPA: HI0074 family nucleotidyltransferase substrate-binding subunit [Armatimonadota bacterium]|jgi:nucleotidyltransferase substrate binding protein (TIGR01987 family)
MPTVDQRLASCLRALATLQEILSYETTVVVRDASIQRFEYTFESVWKLLKAYLQEHEGVGAPSPKQAIRAALGVGLLRDTQAEVMLKMTDDRNLTSHTYIEAVAEAIYQRLPRYSDTMSVLVTAIQNRLAPPPEPG